MEFDQHTELQLMEALEAEPETSQADLAAKVGVAVGTVNWYLKRWSAKGYVKVKRIGRWRWRYLLTSQGMAEKAQLATKYVEASMAIYRQTREEARQLLGQAQAAGYEAVHIDGQGDIADVCALTCLELGLDRPEQAEDGQPVLVVNGRSLELVFYHENEENENGVG
jgi:DNA-binding MarR family transcriptional regulator